MHSRSQKGGRMSLRWLRILALLIPAFSISGQAQSLGEVARQARAERQQAGVHAKVITNDDIERAPAPTQNVFPEKATNDGSATAQTDSAAAPDAKPGSGKSGEKTPDTPEKQREARELEIQKRTQQINKEYLDRIAAIREKISNAQTELATLQREQVESTIEFQRNVGSSPSIAEYEHQQRLFNEQIAIQRTLIVSLNSQLEDAQESARHAGVPHVYD